MAFRVLGFLPKSQVWEVELCTGLGRCQGPATYILGSSELIIVPKAIGILKEGV